MTQKFLTRNHIISLLLVVLLIGGMCLSIFWAAPKFSDPENRLESIQYLDSKRNTVLALTTSAATTSTVLTLLPDDAATPIADKLAELSIYFMVILSAIVLEKYMVTLSGLLVFQYIIPAACVLLILWIVWRDMEWAKTLSVKLLAFGLAVFLLVPATVQACQVIEDTYDTSIQAAITSAQETADIINNSSDEEKTIIAKLLTGAKETISTAVNTIRNVLNNFIEAVAIMLITSCVIPILMIVAFVWLINTILGTNITIPKPVRVKVDTKNRKNSIPDKNPADNMLNP
ncbi:MAG: hypothetical protein IKV52_01285 [Oscillospiraceae bacterium]|nr:hypothetical protein [Oscillospiraceae bacterium]